MKKSKLYPIFLLTNILYTLVFCTNNSTSKKGVWNDLTSSFTIEDEKISYTLPSEPSSWVVAQQETMPTNMLFFSIEKNDGICIGIFDTGPKFEHIKGIEEFSEKDIEVVVRQLASADDKQLVLSEDIQKEREKFEGQEVWQYLLARKVKDYAMPDTISIYYSGFLFNGIKQPYGFVMISGFNPTDSIGKIQFQRYTSTLHLPNE